MKRNFRCFPGSLTGSGAEGGSPVLLLIQLSPSYELNCVLQNLCVEVLTLHVTAFGGRAFKEVVKGKRGHKGRVLI